MSAAVWLLVAWLGTPAQEPLTVSAAVSLTDAFTEIAEVYASAGGGPVRFNFAASNVLARQIVNGAPVDVFISADEAQMDLVERAGRLASATRFELLTNALAVLVPAGATTPVREAGDLAHPGIRRIAIGNPDAVPAGVYARQWLRDTGVWGDIERKIVPVGSVRAALAAVESGSVDAAVVYRSDTAHVRQASVAFVVVADAPRISYPAAVLSRTRLRDRARRFLGFVRSDPRAQRILIKHNFPAPVRG